MLEPGGVGPEPGPKAGSRPGRAGWWAICLLAVAALGAAAFLAGRLTSGDQAAASSTLPAATSSTTTVPVTTTPPVTTTTAPPPATTLPPTTTTAAPAYDEPVGRVAAQVAPAVVQLETSDGLGSGVIFDKEGYILTAAHVVAGAFNVEVRFSDGRRETGFVVGAHRETDVAVVKVEGLPDLPVAELALGAELRVGQLAVALGSPFGLEQSVTSGIVSGVDRVIDGVLMVQTDAAINPGNSGGPLVDADGRVIGINTQIFSTTGVNSGVGFAVGIDLAAIVAEQLIAGEQVRFAFLGVSVSPGPAGEGGALVDDVVRGSAADDAGILVGDLIVAVDGSPISGPAALRTQVISRHPGDTVELAILREGDRLMVTAILDAG